MSTFLPGGPSPKRRRAAMQAALFNARKNRILRADANDAPPSFHFDPASIGTGIVLSNSSRTVAWTHDASISGAKGSPASALSSGKAYFELKFDVAAVSDDGAGLLLTTKTYADMDNNEVGAIAILPSGNLYIDGVNTGQAVNAGVSSGDTVAFAIDFSAHKVWVKNITTSSFWNADADANPATGAGGRTIPSGAWTPAMAFFGTNDSQLTGNFAMGDFVGTAPANFLPWGQS